MPTVGPDRLIVRRGFVGRLAAEGGSARAWATGASAIWQQDGLAGTAPGAGAIAGAAALQAVLEELILRHREARPGILRGLIAGAEQRAGGAAMAEALALFGAGWQHPTFDMNAADRAAALLTLGALLDNPALGQVRALMDGPELANSAGTLLTQLEDGLAAQEPVPPFDAPLPQLLRAPTEASPGSLQGQLDWIADHWGVWLPDRLQTALLQARDLRAEEETARGGGPGEAPVLTFGPGDEVEAFSDDQHWMPRVVLIAKQTYVWLDQLSQRYGRLVRRLDQVPDEELDRLAGQGFNCLWLIGLWERSPASQNIKRRRGNAEAEASAYALRDYRIADALGGEQALDTLRQNALARGLRLAADMVPNHTGLDSEWVAEHPERFVSVPHPPFPGYSFDGPNLSGDDRVEVRLEDGYWSETDAAVVFERRDPATGDVRYLYHGNDGTQMPWNDTAQLDFLNPDVREAVIQEILAVARRFPVIRFDAAMTLAKKHVQRLWYPAPGHGGAIPSRAENSVPADAFELAMPREFWKEVVERVATEVPDTLLLAEAFWMMEGYFVRTLGMHRVYNSAFMHMLRDEDNGKYRQTLKNVLENSPAILERFVNFMNNPDEETAAEQFGKGDKYFGICTLLATLPGLPMFGHGQIEGFAEKYGMEYRRAYWGEEEDEGLSAHHADVIFPLLRRRAWFSGVEHFALFDFWAGEGQVDENVFAYANRGPDGERNLVLYNNAHEGTRGWLRTSAAVNVGETSAPQLEHRPLAGALGIDGGDGVYIGLQDLRTGGWYLRSGRGLNEDGLYVELGGYGCQVFLEWRTLQDDDGTWAALAAHLAGAAVPDLDAARDAMIDSWTPKDPEAEEDEGADDEGSEEEGSGDDDVPDVITRGHRLL
jgi:glycosidase